MKRLSGHEIREMWIRFFEEKGHTYIPGVGLIPQGDKSLLWVNAGVTGLKKYFDGSEVPPSRRIVNVQKSTGGQYYGQVHIMGNGHEGSRGYLLRFFEKGTVDRFARVRSRAYRGRTADELRSSGMGYRGRIKGLWFFRDAVAATKQEVFSGIEDRMEDAVVKQWAKSSAKGGQL